MLVPTEEELDLIMEAKAQAPRSPLGPAEQCLLTLGNVPHLSARLQLWAFTLDHDTLERVRERSYISYSWARVFVSANSQQC